MKKSKRFLTVSAILVLALSIVYFIPEKRKEIKTPVCICEGKIFTVEPAIAKVYAGFYP